MRRIASVLAVALGLLLSMLAGSPASARVVQNSRISNGEGVLVVGNHGSYSNHWTNGSNDTLFIRASIDYDTATEKGRVNIVGNYSGPCRVGDPGNRRLRALCGLTA